MPNTDPVRAQCLSILTGQAVDPHSVRLGGETILLDGEEEDAANLLGRRLSERGWPAEVRTVEFDFAVSTVRGAQANRRLREKKSQGGRKSHTVHWELLCELASITASYSANGQRAARALDLALVPARRARNPLCTRVEPEAARMTAMVPGAALAGVQRAFDDCLAALRDSDVLSRSEVNTLQARMERVLAATLLAAEKPLKQRQAHAVMDRLEEPLRSAGFGKGDIDEIVVGIAYSTRLTARLLGSSARCNRRHRLRRVGAQIDLTAQPAAGPGSPPFDHQRGS